MDNDGEQAAATPTDAMHEKIRSAGMRCETRENDPNRSGFLASADVDVKDLPSITKMMLEGGCFLEMLTCEDRREDLEAMRLSYAFNVFGPSERRVFFVLLALDAPVPSLTSLTPAADWFEREVFDMFGLHFEGHPQLERLLLPEDANFHPLLKDFVRNEEDYS